jgi:hypothetical protein
VENCVISIGQFIGPIHLCTTALWIIFLSRW